MRPFTKALIVGKPWILEEQTRACYGTDASKALLDDTVVRGRRHLFAVMQMRRDAGRKALLSSLTSVHWDQGQRLGRLCKLLNNHMPRAILSSHCKAPKDLSCEVPKG